jgi:hypothetical protein
MANDTTPCNIEQVTRAFVDAPKFLYPEIQNKIVNTNSLWTALIKRENFNYGEGYIKYSETFHGGVGVQDGGVSWTKMQAGRAAGTNGSDDPGYDPCRSQALMVGFGTEEKSFTVYQTERRTADYCLTEILFKWQLEQQLALQFRALSDIAVFEWEQILQAIYFNQCNRRIARYSGSDTKGFNLETLSLTGTTSDNPFGGDISIPAAGLGNIAPLSINLLNQVYPYLSRRCRTGALGMVDGAPVFGVSASQEAIFDMIHNDSKEVEYLKWAAPEINVEGYGKMRVWRNFAQHNDWMAPRYTPNATGTKLTRVYPWKTTPTTLDNALDVNPAYLNAPFEEVSIVVKDVVTAQVPPPNPARVGGGFEFNPVNNIMDFEFMNIQERCENPRREKGFFLGRARVAPKPEAYSTDALSMLVRRCGVSLETGCTTCSTANTSSTAVTSVAFFDSGASYTTAVKYILAGLASCFSVQVGSRVAVTYTSNGGATMYGVVVDNSDPLNIVVVLDSAYTTRDLTAQTGVTVAATTQPRS